jgi:hypothetical protein
MGSRDVRALETMEQLLVSLRRIRDEADEAVRLVIEKIERDQAYLLALMTAGHATRRELPKLHRSVTTLQ